MFDTDRHMAEPPGPPEIRARVGFKALRAVLQDRQFPALTITTPPYEEESAVLQQD